MSKKAIKRGLILEAAIDVFSEKEFKNSSISEIAQKASVSEGTIYQYFKNKEDLFFSTPIEKTEEFDKQLELHLQGITGPLEKIRKYMWFFLYIFEANPSYAKIFFLELRVNKNFMRTEADNWVRRSSNKILDILKEGQAANIIRNDSSIYLMRQLMVGFLAQVIMRWLLTGRDYSLTQQYEQISDLIISAIKVPNKKDIVQ